MAHSLLPLGVWHRVEIILRMGRRASGLNCTVNVAGACGCGHIGEMMYKKEKKNNDGG